MSDLLNQLRVLAEKRDELVQRLSENADNLRVSLALSSIRKQIKQAEDRLNIESGYNQFDILRYRVENNSDRYSVAALLHPLYLFQKSLTALADFSLHGPKRRARFSDEAAEISRLDVAYTFPGSFGFVLSVSNERDLFYGKMDKSISVLRDYLNIQSTFDAVECSREIGLAATSQLFQWVNANAEAKNSVDYTWRRSDDAFFGQSISLKDFTFLRELFLEAEEVEIETVQETGVLVGLELTSKRFHFISDSSRDFKGSLDLSDGRLFSLPKRYLATIETKRRLMPSTGEIKEEFVLLNLGEL